MLLGFYLLIPVAKQICAKREVVRYYLILWIVFRFLFPYLTDLFHLYTFQARIDSLGMDTLAGNFGYFLLGYYLDRTDLKPKIRRLIYVMGIGAVGMTMFLTVRDCMETGTYVESWFSPASPNVLIMSAAIFIGFKYGKAFDAVKRTSVWQKLAGYTFFCIHVPHVYY